MHLLTEEYNAALDKCDVVVIPTLHCLPGHFDILF